MIRMILIYTGLFVAAAVALWLRPSGDAVASVAPEVAPGTEQTAGLSSSFRPSSRPGQAIAAPLRTVSAAEMERFNSQSGLASLVVRELTEDSSGSGLVALEASADGAVDLEPLLDVPGSIRNEDGTRVLASALLRRGDQVSTSGLSNEITGVTTLSVAPKADDGQFYVVQPGDSLASIARDHYGSTAAFREIYDANRDILKSMDAIRVGQRLHLP